MKRVALIISLCLIPSLTMALSPEYKVSVIKEANYLIWKYPHIVYKWGGTDIYGKHEADCSGTFYSMFLHLGIPVQRMEAINMEAGKGGWRNKACDLDNADETTMVWWSWGLKKYKEGAGPKPTRTHGHIGMFLKNKKSGLLEVMHNNLSRGLHIEPLRGPLYDDISSIKDLTIGEKEAPKLGKGIIQTK
jgi:cell wall-associated NlpC family hydrolase